MTRNEIILTIAIYIAIALDTCATDAAICCVAKRRFRFRWRSVVTMLLWPVADVLVIISAYNHTKDFTDWSKDDF